MNIKHYISIIIIATAIPLSFVLSTGLSLGNEKVNKTKNAIKREYRQLKVCKHCQKFNRRKKAFLATLSFWTTLNLAVLAAIVSLNPRDEPLIVCLYGLATQGAFFVANLATICNYCNIHSFF